MPNTHSNPKLYYQNTLNFRDRQSWGRCPLPRNLGHWCKLTPRRPNEVGEKWLKEVLCRKLTATFFSLERRRRNEELAIIIMSHPCIDRHIDGPAQSGLKSNSKTWSAKPTCFASFAIFFFWLQLLTTLALTVSCRQTEMQCAAVTAIAGSRTIYIDVPLIPGSVFAQA